MFNANKQMLAWQPRETKMAIMVNLPFNYEHFNQGCQLSFTHFESHTTSLSQGTHMHIMAKQ